MKKTINSTSFHFDNDTTAGPGCDAMCTTSNRLFTAKTVNANSIYGGPAIYENEYHIIMGNESRSCRIKRYMANPNDMLIDVVNMADELDGQAQQFIDIDDECGSDDAYDEINMASDALGALLEIIRFVHNNDETALLAHCDEFNAIDWAANPAKMPS